jgi:hypothetical protein
MPRSKVVARPEAIGDDSRKSFDRFTRIVTYAYGPYRSGRKNAVQSELFVAVQKENILEQTSC